MGEHGKREHALLSASSAHRWMACTPSARLEEQFSDTTSESAQEGTLAHELAEARVRNYFYGPDFTKRKLTFAIKKLKEDKLWDDEMLGYTDVYLDYIKSVALPIKGTPSVKIEQRVYFKDYTHEDPENDIEGSGIADCILLYDDTVHVVDLKYGKSPNGRVSAEMNPQLMLYALGAYQMYRVLYPVKHIKLAIVQPRLQDGISEWGCSIEELLAFGEYVKTRAALAWEGKGVHNPSEKTCHFCRARAQCRAWSDYNVKHAFNMGDLPPLITAEEAGKRLLELETVVKYQKDLQEWALAECLAGREVPGWKAVEGRGSRDWTDMDKAFEVLQQAGINRAILYEEKPLALAQVEKIVGKKDFMEAVGTYIAKNPGKPALAKGSDKREAITNKITAAEAFKEENQNE